ncbi:hypothetical protein [Pedobacter duraquae]|nr:hypothetical protein [Pedobacter duraquae]
MKKLTSFMSLINLTTLVLFFLPTSLLAGGLSSFQERTPYDNTVYYDGSAGSPVTFMFGATSRASEAISKQATQTAFSDFYFYKGYVIAETDTSFTVINEKQPSVNFFNDQSSFDAYLDANNLRPKIWTRWYNKNYDEANFKPLSFMAFYYFPVSIFIIGLTIYFTISIRKTKNNAYKSFKKVYLIGLVVFIAFVYFLQVFPQSF